MFNNLIESNSHTREFKRRGSFFLFTVGAYAMLFAAAGVASIFAYDAHLDEQSTELEVVMFVPLPEVKPAPAEVHRTPSQDNTARSNSQVTTPTRQILIDRADNPTNVPTEIGIKAASVPPAPAHAVIGLRNLDPLGSGKPGPPGVGSEVNGLSLAQQVGTPPPAPSPSPKKIVIASRILNGVAIYLPKPPYPEIAKQIHLSGSVNVQVLIDETGRVVSAHAVSGHPLLTNGAVQAARQARFSPTILGDTPVRLSGIITYNFLLQ